MDFRHIKKGLNQANKAHKNRSKSGGKIETRSLMGRPSSAAVANMNKNQRFHAMNEQRKLKREELLMKRRGLNFVTEHHDELLSEQTVQACEEQLDNVAPRIVALLSLSESGSTTEVRNALVG